MLQFLMEQNRLTPADLPLPANRVSEILSGKRGVSKEQAKQLGAFFGVSPGLFI
jgi:antitoxin component HigA of HigAB toxin-antitoxin module